MKVKSDDTDASISCSVAIYQNLLVACYRGMALLVSSYMYCLASYHAVELCRPCIYFDQIPLALGIRVLINILVVILTPRLYFAEALANGWLNWRTMCLTSNHMNPSAIWEIIALAMHLKDKLHLASSNCCPSTNLQTSVAIVI